MKLASRIVLLCLLAMTTMSALFSYLTIRRDEQFFAEEHGRTASELAKAVKPQISDAAEGHASEHDLTEAVRACSVEFRHVSMRYVRFNHLDSETKPSAPEEKLATIFQDERVTVTTTEPDGQRKIHTIVPLSKNGEDGGLEISRTMQSVDDRARSTLWNSLLALLGVTLLCIGVVVVGGVRMIGRPLGLLIEKTRRIGEGDFSEPVKLPGNTELTQLGNALDEMCGRLDAQQKTIESEAASRLLAEQQLRHADRLNTVGRLAAGIAHEMGTPLNVVSGRAALIADGKLSDDEVRQSANTIKSEADRITKIIRQLLDFARRHTLHKTVVDVRDVVDQSVELLSNIAEKQGVTIGVSGESCRTYVDEGQLQQVFANLIMNALQSIKGAGVITIRLKTEEANPPSDVAVESGDFIRIDMTDTGGGIAAEDQEYIFEPFFTTKDVGEGTGLGLSISYGIVRDHDGWIEVTSEPGEGSCFSVFLPTQSTAN